METTTETSQTSRSRSYIRIDATRLVPWAELRATFEPLEISSFGLHVPMHRPRVDRLFERPAAEVWAKEEKGSELPTQVYVCERFLEDLPRTKTIQAHSSSYCLKHAAEAWAGDYVPNGALIMAAIRLGFLWRPCGPVNPNAFFNLSSRRRWPDGKCNPPGYLRV